MRFLYLLMLSSLLAIGVLGLSGCSTFSHRVEMTELPSPAQQYLTDQTPDDDYPGILRGEGNDYSCRYGIHLETKGEFSPPKAQLFGNLLAQDLPAITAHKVVLQRFDVYYNHRLREFHALTNGVLGGPGSPVDELAANPNMGLFRFEKVLIDTRPEVDRYPNENQVGCSNAHEGEYYPSEISGGHDAVVSWFKFTVDEREYEFRTFYQFQPYEDKAAQTAGIDEAIRMSVQGIAKQIQL